MSMLKSYQSGAAITAKKSSDERASQRSVARKNFGTLIFEAPVYKINIKDEDG
jgi:hypothetical protein